MGLAPQIKAPRVEVIQPGTQTTIQDYPGRIGYWQVGVPPSGPMDSLAFRFGNWILGNKPTAAGLEITLSGPELTFHQEVVICLTGAPVLARLNGAAMPQWHAVKVKAGSRLSIGFVKSGVRACLCFKNGLIAEPYLGSSSTFTLGKFGGLAGRALQLGDELLVGKESRESGICQHMPQEHIPVYSSKWDLRVLYGPQGAPDFLTEEDIEEFFSTSWKVHHNSSRTGIRLIGPKPRWARPDGGEAGLHPSNLHDNAYAIGSVDFTGDMPVILGPDGPSLGGFVCPATVISADLWKLGQLKAGDEVRFVQVELDQARALEDIQAAYFEATKPRKIKKTSAFKKPHGPILYHSTYSAQRPDVVYRIAGDANILIEFGEMTLDLEYRLRVHCLMHWVEDNLADCLIDVTPGIRSLQVHYDAQKIELGDLLERIRKAEQRLESVDEISIPMRHVYLPLSWDDESTQKAISIYSQSVRSDAPWCPSNIEFIRRINGLENTDSVKQIVFDASYLVMGLGDVYLGAPVATPLDPRHRLVTTKYNPARTWTPENAVGIGGAYLCVYGMEGPGGYQFVGRTLQMWDRGGNTKDFEAGKPWLLRLFDQIHFYPVSADELVDIRQEFPDGNYPLRIEEGEFKFGDYKKFLSDHEDSIHSFKKNQQAAFDAEKKSWIETGELKYTKP